MKPTMCGHTRRTSGYLVLRSVSHYKSPFNTAPHRQAHPERREEGLLDTTLLGPSLEPACVPSGSLSTLSPYSRKPSPFGPKMSICAKGVSRGVHNIAFLLSPDRFRAFTFVFFIAHIFKSGHESQRATKILQRTKERIQSGHKSEMSFKTWTCHRLVQKVAGWISKKRKRGFTKQVSNVSALFDSSRPTLMTVVIRGLSHHHYIHWARVSDPVP